MRMAPNKTVLEGKVTGIEPAADGWGANVEFEVTKSGAGAGSEDFLGAAPGTTLTLFTTEPEKVAVGKFYKITATVLGGPNGERTVIEKAVKTH